MATGPPEVLEKDLGCLEATDKLPGQAGSAQRRPRKDGRKDADTTVSSDGESGGAHGLKEARTPLGISEHDPDKPELSMPEPASLGVDKKKRVEKVGAKSGTAGPPVPKSLPVQRKVEPPSLDPSEEPLLWEGLTLNKCILVASVVALLSVTFQVLQAPCPREGVSHGRQDPPPPPVHEAPPEVVSAKEEEVQEEVTAQPPLPESSAVEDDDGDEDGDDYGDDDADSNLAEPWIFKKWFGRSTPEDEDEDEDEDEEPTAVPEVPAAAVELKKSQEKKPEKKEEKKEEKPEKKEEKPEKMEEKPEKKEEKVRESRPTQAERSSRREARARDRALGDKAGRAPRTLREPEQQPQRKRVREGKESRRERERERDEPRKEGWKGRPGRGDGGRESPKRDWRQQKGRKPWESTASPGKDGIARPREGKRRD